MNVAVMNYFKGTFEVTKAFYETFRECKSTDETRYFMQHVYYNAESGEFAATDGKRLIVHAHEFDDVESGFYELAKVGKKYKLLPVKLDGRFPNYRRVIPELSHYELFTYEKVTNSYTGKKEFVDSFSINGKFDQDSTFICMLAQGSMVFNIDYVTKVLKHVGGFKVYIPTEEKERKNNAVYVEIDDNTQYVFMPMMF
jgi:DNA polymerase III sliding clamp (beta) subunit (PCNA family)